MSTRRAPEGKDAVRKHLLDLDNRLPALLAEDSSPYEGLLLTVRLHRGGIDAIQHWLSRPSTVDDVDVGGCISVVSWAACAGAA